MFRRFRYFVWLFAFLFPMVSAVGATQHSHKTHAKTHAKKKVVHRRSRLSAAHRSKLHRAFVASASLRPMAKQLLADRTPAAYAGVEHYAWRHRKDDGGALAHLVLGYAHLQDKDYAKATADLKLAAKASDELSDYADFFLADAASATQDQKTVAAILKDFAAKHPDSLFTREANLMRASSLLNIGQTDSAVQLLESMRDGDPDVELELGKAYVATSQPAKAVVVWNSVLTDTPLSPESQLVQAELSKLSAQGLVTTPTLQQRITRADLLYTGRRYDQAATEYRSILGSIQSDANAATLQRELNVKLGGALYHQHQLDQAKSLLEGVPEGQDEIEARRLYYLHEIARSNNDADKEKQLLGQMMQKFPASPWLQEALLSASNMYLLQPDFKTAIEDYSAQYKLFPKGKYSPYSHWKAAWLNYRLDNKAEAERLMEEQIALYPDGQEVPPALYWRARLAEDDGDSQKAGEYYSFLLQRFPHYYYADLARERLHFRFNMAQHDPLLSRVPPQPDPDLDSFDAPSDDLRVDRAKLLTNAALDDFAIRELQSESDKLYAKAEIARIYVEEDRPDRALQTLKHAVPGYFAEDVTDLPQWAWDILFPKPFWNDLARYARVNGLDPYLVASLVRQESEFNPQAVSRANAWGLMQLLPSNGRQLAREVKIRHFRQDELTNPTVNLQLGTRYFKHMIDSFGGQVEYALAAYNAGADRVKNWQSQGPYRDVPEFVESIPFSETREYVQAIMRNATVYRLLYSGEGIARRRNGAPDKSDKRAVARNTRNSESVRTSAVASAVETEQHSPDSPQ
ncbi:MAG TPA: transglycosylase SLT domain-containing protein [Terriglobales bacterium]|nr:transglycosylase SLT domain-containing protein [Terriglobales bacterium]